jgi:O-antigen ligase
MTLLLRLHLPVAMLALGSSLLARWYGGYHVRHFGWVALALIAWACVEAARGRLSAPRSLAGVATLAMLGLALWTLASLWWVDVSRHDAWVETVRACAAAAAFVLGTALLASGRSFARYVGWLSAGIGIVAAVTTMRLIVFDAPLKLFTAGRLDAPIGYAPGFAALQLMGVLMLLGLAGKADRAWRESRARGALALGAVTMGAASLCLSLALLAQSRGTLVAMLVAAAASLVVFAERSGWLLRAGVLIAGSVVMWSALGDPYQTQFTWRQAPFTEGADADALLAAAVDAARSAGATAALGALAIAAIGAALVPLNNWLGHHLAAAQDRAGMHLAVPVIIGVVTMVIVLGALNTDQVSRATSFVGEQWRACAEPEPASNDPGRADTYFATTGTGRCDYYRVALKSWQDNPVTGLGAGNFRGAYVRLRTTNEEPRATHSMPLQLLAELGIIGAALGLTVLVCIGWAALRFVRSGRDRDPVFAGAIAAVVYWLAHSWIDWLWQLPAITIPALVLSGGLVACVSPGAGRVRAIVAAPIAAGVLIISIGLVLPVTMADSALRTARDPKLQARDPARALEAARDAQAFDPTWAEPVITEGSLLYRAGQKQDAARAGVRAVELEPRNWSVLYRASGLIALTDRAAGRAATNRAAQLNPLLAQFSNQRDDAAEETSGAFSPDSLQNPDA